MSGKPTVMVSRPGPIIADAPEYQPRYTGPISDVERWRLQPLTAAVLDAKRR